MIKLKVTKKQQRIIDDIMSQLNDRQRQYVEENHALFPGSSLLPFLFYLSFDKDDRFGTRLGITAIPTYVKNVYRTPNLGVLFFSEFDGDEVSVDYFWEHLCKNLKSDWDYIRQFLSEEIKYLPMLQNTDQYEA